MAALLELVAEGDLSPAAEAVAARAGVGLRTVFRLFRDMDSLYAEMFHHILSEVAAVIAPPLKGATWREQLTEIVGRRGRVYERIAPYQRASAGRRWISPFLEASHRRLVDACRLILEDVVPADAPDRATLIELLDLTLSFEAWDRLRRDQGLSASRARAALTAAVSRLTAA